MCVWSRSHLHLLIITMVDPNITEIIERNQHFDETPANPVTISNHVDVIEHSSQSPGHSEKIPIKYRYRLALVLLSFMGLSVVMMLVQTGSMSPEQAKEFFKLILGSML
jgi:hypothetical protein